MTKYAENTQVPVERSKAEIDKVLRKYGATAIVSGAAENRAFVQFEMSGRRVQFVLDIPSKDERRFTRDRWGSMRSQDAAQKSWDKAHRQRWRALLLVIKAKLEAVESEITVFDEEFMAHIILPDGKTVSQHMIPQIVHAYEHGSMPPLLPEYGS